MKLPPVAPTNQLSSTYLLTDIKCHLMDCLLQQEDVITAARLSIAAPDCRQTYPKFNLENLKLAYDIANAEVEAEQFKKHPVEFIADYANNFSNRLQAFNEQYPDPTIDQLVTMANSTDHPFAAQAKSVLIKKATDRASFWIQRLNAMEGLSKLNDKSLTVLNTLMDSARNDTISLIRLSAVGGLSILENKLENVIDTLTDRAFHDNFYLVRLTAVDGLTNKECDNDTKITQAFKLMPVN